MLFVYYQLTVLLLVLTVLGVEQFSSSYYNTIWNSMYIFLGVFHVSLLKLQVKDFYPRANMPTDRSAPLCLVLDGKERDTIFDYSQVWLHFWIHGFKAKYTILETKQLSRDDIWHFGNQSMTSYYLQRYNPGSIPTKIYMASVLTYVTLLSSWSGCKKLGFKRMRDIILPLMYYLGALLEALFILTMETWDRTVLPATLGFLIVSHMITYENRIGRFFINRNIAGCAFLAEFTILYLIHNKIL